MVTDGIVGNQTEVLEEHVHVFPIRHWRDGCGFVQRTPILPARTVQGSLPNELATPAVETKREQFFLFERRQKYEERREDRRRFSSADRCPPDGVPFFAELYGESGIFRNARSVRPSKARPVFRIDTSQQHG